MTALFTRKTTPPAVQPDGASGQPYKIKLLQARWIFYLSAAVVIGSIMSFGLITFLFFDLDRQSAIFMLGMILPMTFLVIICLNFILKAMEKRISRLLFAIKEVSNGNLDVVIDTKGAEEYKEIYESFNLMVKELRITKEEMQSFVNELAHEFKTPITSISGFADYLYQTGDTIETAERMQFLKLISDQSQRLASLSQNTLLLSKLEACQIVTEKETFALGEQIKQCVILLLRPFEQKHITVDIPEDFDFDYCGNKELMEQIWINLLNNALKFTPEGGTVTVGCKKTASALEISVADTGVGMDEETQEKIFDKYYQNDTTNLTKGNGIGLSIVRRIVELCGGSIAVESQPGCGSTFTVTLPC